MSYVMQGRCPETVENHLSLRNGRKSSVVDPDPVRSESFCRIGIGIQGKPIRI